jgi:HlyD family secretion protein
MAKKSIAILCILVLIIMVPYVKKAILKGDAKRVQTMKLSEHTIRSYIVASGVLKYDEVLLSSEYVAKVSKVYVSSGTEVKKGDLLLSLDSASLLSVLQQNYADVQLNEALVAKADIQLKNATDNRARAEKLKELRFTSDREFENAKLEFDGAVLSLRAAKANLARAKAKITEVQNQLSKMDITSPINGVVTSCNVKQGETAIPSTYGGLGNVYLMKLANPNSIHAELYVDEADVAKIGKGQNVNIRVIAYQDQIISGTVSYLSDSAEVIQGRNGKSFLVKVQLDKNQVLNLKDSMSIRAEIFTAPAVKGLAVPAQAVVYEPDPSQTKKKPASDKSSDPYIFLVKDGVAVKTRVELGPADDEYQIVSNKDISLNELVVTGPDFDLRHMTNGAPLIVN